MIEMRMAPGYPAAASLTQVKLIATRFPGEHELTIVIEPQSPGRAARRLTLGSFWLYDGSPACMAALNEFGAASVVDADR